MTIKENGEDVSVCAHCALNNAGEQHFAVSNSKLWQDPAQSRGEPPRGFTYDMGTQPRK